jgi:prepilin-type N-terminal cleavage/methylation domain-containing protein
MPDQSVQPVRRYAAVAGFTLIELIMVLAIIVILSAMAIPRFSGSIARNRADAAARLIQADLLLAQRHAMTASVDQEAVFEITKDAAILRLTGLPDLDHPNQRYAHDLLRDPYSVSSIAVDFDGSPGVVFDMYGAPNAGGTVVLRVGGEVRTITLDPDTGETSVSE